MNTSPIPVSRAFRGQNFITPHVVGYRAGTLAGKRVHVEISRESPPYFSQVVAGDPKGGPMIGVTLRRPDGSRLDPDPSRSFSSLEEAEAYLAEL